jgi:acetyl esterase
MSQPLPNGLEPVTRGFLADILAQDPPPLFSLPVDQARQVLADVQQGSIANPPVDADDHQIPAGPKSQPIGIHVVRPRGAAQGLPVVMYFHGGGWVLGDRHTHDRLTRELAVAADAAVVFVDYTRSPEARFPQAIEEAYAATAWVAANGKSLGVDGSRLAVAGDSAGGNMATVTALLARERGGPAINCQVLFYPVTDASFETASYRQFAAGPWLLRDAMHWFWDHYCPDEAKRRLPTASPLRASDEQLRGLPPTFLATAEFDVLRDEGEAYAARLASAGTRVTAVRYLGTIHDFLLLDALADTPAAGAALRQAAAVLRQAFAGVGDVTR